MKKITDWLLGRTTAFCVGFFITGNVMHFVHKLDATYISFMTVLMGFVLGHSVKCDIADKNGATNSQSVTG